MSPAGTSPANEVRRTSSVEAEGWETFLASYHAANPAITEDLLVAMRGPGGLQPYAWLTDGLPTDGLVWDVCCGSAPVADVVGHHRYAGVDTSPDELAQAAARRPTARVVAGDAMTTDPPAPVAAVTVAMALMLLPLAPFLARVAGMLPPGGAFAAIVPSREDAGSTGYGTLLRLLGQTGRGYRQPLARDAVREAIVRAGLEPVDDEVAVFRRPVPPADVDLVVRSFYVRDAEAPGPAAARAWLADAAGSPEFRLEYPLRRIRAVRR